jgi:hypothetical protein
MDLIHHTEPFADATRRDGWTPALKARFLALLAETGNTRLSARRCGLSAQSAYVQRRRDAAFARGWAAALVHARRYGEQVLADRALEGVEEQIYYRGELVGTRRRYDSRLLLAHLARLDRMAQDEAALRDADRFDELLALIAGEEVPAVVAVDDDLLPASCEDHAEAVAQAAERAAQRALPAVRGKAGKAQRAAAVEAAGDEAFAAGAAEWDGWHAHACAVVDALAHGDPPPPAAVPSPPSDPGPCKPVNFAPAPLPRLTCPAVWVNGPPRSAAPAAGHPSETVGAAGLP